VAVSNQGVRPPHSVGRMEMQRSPPERPRCIQVGPSCARPVWIPGVSLVLQRTLQQEQEPSILTVKAEKMETSEEVPDLAALVHGYEQRVNAVIEYMTQAADLLARLGQEQDAMVSQVRGTMAKRRSLRRRDFDRLVWGVVEERRQRLEELPAVIGEFRRTEEAVIARLRGLLDGTVGDVARAWPAIKKEMMSLQRTRERDVSRALKRVHIEQEELCRGFKGLLTKGERVRIADLKRIVREIRAISPKETDDLTEILRDCQSACAEVSETWQEVV
jgi:hypothetical protein